MELPCIRESSTAQKTVVEARMGENSSHIDTFPLSYFRVVSPLAILLTHIETQSTVRPLTPRARIKELPYKRIGLNRPDQLVAAYPQANTLVEMALEFGVSLNLPDL